MPRAGNKQRINRSAREHEKGGSEHAGSGAGGGGMKQPGPRAQANSLEARHGEEGAEEMVSPGIHDEIKQVAAAHGPAHETHTFHDHVGQRSHMHSLHPDGYEHHTDHMGPGHADEAHQAAAHAAGGAAEGENEPPESEGLEELPEQEEDEKRKKRAVAESEPDEAFAE
jgi:hypothetical protein